MMKKIKNIAVWVIVACIIQACAGSRSTTNSGSSAGSGPMGPVTPATGSASNIASGRNTIGIPIASNETAATAGIIESNKDGTITSAEGAVNKNNADFTQDDSQFITEAALSGIAEISLSELALEKSQNADVKSFAAMVIKDHEHTNAQLKSLAESKSITLPNLNITDTTTSGKVDTIGPDSGNKHIETAANAAPGAIMDINQKIKKLKTSTGKELDQQYLQMMIHDHQKAISLFEQGAKSSDPQIKAYAIKYLPTLKMHLKNVTSLNIQ